MIKKLIKQLIPNSFKAKWRSALGVPSQETSFDRLQKLNFKPKLVLDIGAYEGHWALQFHQIFPEAEILMFEGQLAKEPILKILNQKNPSIHYKMDLLGAKKQEVTFHIYETASSVLAEANITGAKLETRTLSTLDELLKGTPFEKPDFIKIDTQGYELAILQGGLHTLSHANVVLLEVSLLPIYEQCPLVDEVLLFMKLQGFVLYDICSLMRRPLDEALFQSDFLFVRIDAELRKDHRWTS